MARRDSDTSPRRRHAASPTLCIRALHHSPSVSVYDVGCRPHDVQRGAEACSRNHQIVFPRRGVFERETRGRKLLADPNQVLFFNREESYRVAHPGGGGDDCTVFTFDEGLSRDAIAEWDPAWVESSSQLFRFAQVRSEARVFWWQDWLRRTLARGGEQLAIDETRDREVGHRAAARRTGRAHGLASRNALLRRPLASCHRTCSALLPLPFGTAIRARSGISIHQYRHRLRLREGLRRLAEGEANLSALALGFSSHSHFSAAFRQAFGLSTAQSRIAPATRWRAK